MRDRAVNGTRRSAVGGLPAFLGFTLLLLSLPADAQQLAGDPSWLEPEAVYGQVGISLAGADVNGDGYDDVVLGAPFFFTPCCPSINQQGAVLLYYGSPQGLADVQGWLEIGAHQGTTLGYRVANAGDVNDDGKDDLLFNAGSGFGNGTHAVHLRFGSAAGPTGTWSYDTGLMLPALGPALDGGGDVNGDGFDDIVAGFPHFDGGAGKVVLFHGSPTGPGVLPDWEESGAAGQRLGLDVAFAGDVDSDGYDDLLVCDRSPSNTDRVSLYRGSPAGLRPATSWTYDVPDAVCEFGEPLDGAGDLNGDGYDDVAIGERNRDHSESTGVVLIFLGSETGLGSEPDALLLGDDEFGYAVSAMGDVNADGFADLAVGAPGTGPEDGPGRAHVFYGTASGIFPDPIWTNNPVPGSFDFAASVSAVDVNGDGLPELLAGDPNAPVYAFGRAALFSNVVTLVAGPAGAIIPGGNSGLYLARASDGSLDLTWGPSCAGPGEDYIVYEGSIGDFADHHPINPCGTGGAPSWNVPTAGGSRYYVVVARSLDSEGSYGLDGDGDERPPSTEACFTQALAACD